MRSLTKSCIFGVEQTVEITKSEFLEKNGEQSGKKVLEVSRLRLHVMPSEENNLTPNSKCLPHQVPNHIQPWLPRVRPRHLKVGLSVFNLDEV